MILQKEDRRPISDFEFYVTLAATLVAFVVYAALVSPIKFLL